MRDKSSKPIVIYALCDPRTGAIRYIGKSWQPSRRLIYHVYHARRGTRHLPVHRWIWQILKRGLRPTLLEIESVLPGADWASRERHWIENYRAVGAKLLNLTDGGEGLTGYLFAGTLHARRIAAKMRRGANLLCDECSKRFYQKLKEINKSRSGAHFCSRACYLTWQVGRTKKISADFTAKGVAAAAAVRHAQTHCKRGHPLSGENLFINSNGARGCKECRKLHSLKHRSAKR